jgi:hypothetical protein
MTRRIGLLPYVALAGAALGVAALFGGITAARGEGEATFRIDPPSQNATLTQTEVAFTVMLDDAVNLAAWESGSPLIPTSSPTRTFRHPVSWRRPVGRNSASVRILRRT